MPEPKGFECLIKTGAAGFCHTASDALSKMPVKECTYALRLMMADRPWNPLSQDAMVANGEFEKMGCKCPITVSDSFDLENRIQRLEDHVRG